MFYYGMNIKLSPIYTAIVKQKKLPYQPSFKGTCSMADSFTASERYSNIKNETAKNFFREIDAQSKEKSNLILSQPYAYDLVNSNCGYLSDNYPELHQDELNAMKMAILNTDIEDLKQIAKDLTERLEDSYLAGDFINAVILFNKDKDAFEYILNTPKKKSDIEHLSCDMIDVCKYVLTQNPAVLSEFSLNTVREVAKGIENKYEFSAYTLDSDKIKQYPEEVAELSNALSKEIVEGDFKAYRAERSSWIFESVPLDKNFQKEIRIMAFLNPKSRKDMVFPNAQKFAPNSNQYKTIYEHIKSKKELTLADAMLLARYGNKRYIDKILKLIDSTSINDNNFKSYTLDKKFAESWKRPSGLIEDRNMVGIITTANIKKGNQGAYTAKSGQMEFILNNNSKKISFNNAHYDKETNTFYIDSTVEAL